MAISPSRIVLGTPEGCSNLPGQLFAFGDRDDPMRLTVLLADHVAGLLPGDRKAQDRARTCLDPRATWRARRDALGDVLALGAEQLEGHFIAFVDVDALAPQGQETWTSDRALSMRKELFGLLLNAVERGGWLVLRTCPSRSLSAELADLDVEITDQPEPAADVQAGEVKLFAPDVRPIAAWLLRRAGFRPRDLSRIVEDVADADAHLVHLAYQMLSPTACDTGELIATLRPPQHINGCLGPLTFADQRPSATRVPRRGVEELRAAGFLQSGAEGSALRMPRLVCKLLRGFALLSMEDEVQRIHSRLGAEPITDRSKEDQIEIHHHAVKTGDLELAMRTAVFYGTELRDLATRMGLEAKRCRDRSKHRKAAEIFEHVIHRFDGADAYAWEYLGYNLALTRDAAQRDRIRHAYEQAHRLWPTNPLYHGRLLGFLGQHGDDIAREVVRWIDRYVNQYGDEHEAVSYFVEPALRGLLRGGRSEQIAWILKHRRSILERFAPQALVAPGDVAAGDEE